MSEKVTDVSYARITKDSYFEFIKTQLLSQIDAESEKVNFVASIADK